MLITDTVKLGDVRVNDAGYLETFAHTARIGVQQYLGREAGRPDIAVVNVYRDEAEVFSKRSLDTFAKIPVTLDHPAEPVTSTNWKRYAVGTTGEEVLRDGERLKIGLKITDKSAVDAVQAGKRELSVGYSTELVWEDGTAPDGTPYQARQTNIVADHIAIVAAGRAGPRCRIGDSWAAFTSTTDNAPKEGLMADLRKVMVDGLQVETTDAGAAAIDKLQKDKQAIEAKLSDAQVSNDKAMAAKDADLAKKDAEIDSLKAKILSDADLDKRVQQRADLITTAKTIVGDSFEHAGKSDADIRRAVVVAKLGDAAVKDKADAYIDASFDILAEDSGKSVDGLRKAVRDAKPAPNLTADEANAYAASLADLNRKPEAA